jgi:hypothetical protein
MPSPKVTIERLNCPLCAQSGLVAWDTSSDDRTIENLVMVSSGFHWEINKARPDQPLIMCDVCEEIQPRNRETPD